MSNIRLNKIGKMYFTNGSPVAYKRISKLPTVEKKSNFAGNSVIYGEKLEMMNF